MGKSVFALDLAGKKFGKWAVKGFAYKNSLGEVYWDCICECGTQRPVKAGSLSQGRSISCGCHHRSRVTSHGYTGKPTFLTWQAMKQRCLYTKAINYSGYGGRGIKICDRWLESFENFLADMGDKPKGKSLDRIDVQGPYSPENCRWADNNTQQRNRSDTKYFTLNGKTQSQIEWAEQYGITSQLLGNRLKAGWHLAEALTTPRDMRKSTNRPHQKSKEP